MGKRGKFLGEKGQHFASAKEKGDFQFELENNITNINSNSTKTIGKATKRRGFTIEKERKVCTGQNIQSICAGQQNIQSVFARQNIQSVFAGQHNYKRNCVGRKRQSERATCLGDRAVQQSRGDGCNCRQMKCSKNHFAICIAFILFLLMIYNIAVMCFSQRIVTEAVADGDCYGVCIDVGSTSIDLTGLSVMGQYQRDGTNYDTDQTYEVADDAIKGDVGISNGLYWGKIGFDSWYSSSFELLNIDLTNVKEKLTTEGSKIGLSFQGFTVSFPSTATSVAINNYVITDFSKMENIGIAIEGRFNAILYVVQAQWEEASIAINYFDEGGVAFSGTHASGYPTKHRNGVATSLDEPTKAGYDFVGWFTDSACTQGITELSADENYESINLYAKWSVKVVTLTLNCTNFDNQNYIIYIYRDGVQYMQVFPQSGLLTLRLPYEEHEYAVQFVFGYYGAIEYTKLTNASASGRKATLVATLKDASITYILSTPKLNGIVV